MATSDNQLASFVDYKIHSLMKPIKRYYRVGKWLKGKNIRWVPTSVYTDMPDAGTVMRLATAGYSTLTPVAKY